MESELDFLLGTAINNLAKLNILLYFHARPGILKTPNQLAAILHLAEQSTARSLEELAQVGLIDRIVLGSGRHIMYGPLEEERIYALLGALHERYHRDPDSRVRLVRRILGQATEAN